MKAVARILTHRVTVVTVLIIIQLLALVMVTAKFHNYFVFFYGMSAAASALAVLWIVSDNTNPAYKIAWIIPILLFPIFGGLFYLLFGRNRLSRRDKKRMQCIADRTREALARDGRSSPAIVDETAAIQSRYIRDYAHCPPYANTQAEYLPAGEIALARLREELGKAKRYIFLEYFIIAQGVVWDSILAILKDKVKQGVDVRIIYDDVGSLLTLPYRYDKQLEEMGIKCGVFNPLRPVLSPKMNHRDHRKIAVIDGEAGFTGGINLADEYGNVVARHGYWKDSAIMLKGPAVFSLTVMFLSMWEYLKGCSEDYERFRAGAVAAGWADGPGIQGYVQPFTDSPLDSESVGETTYLNLINRAGQYVYITTPYLIIDNELATALTSAAKGGVDVRIVTPHTGDNWLVHEVTRSYYKSLVESGVKIYEYTPGFIHSKTFVADDEYAIVGSINLDYRSLYLHFECGVWLHKSSAVAAIKDDFLATLRVSKQVTPDQFTGMPWYRRLLVLVLRVFAPLM